MPYKDQNDRKAYETYYRSNPEYAELQWKRQLKIVHNMTADEYVALLEEQGNGCAICGKSPEENGKRLAVDHDHSCCPGVKHCGTCVRGLLCNSCNNGIGRFNDTPELLEAAAKYLRNS